MNLREKNGYTYGAFSEFRYYRDGGVFYSGAQVRTDVTAPAAKELFSELNRIRTDPPTAAELKLAEDSELHSLPGQFETVKETSGLMSDLFTYALAEDLLSDSSIAISETDAGRGREDCDRVCPPGQPDRARCRRSRQDRVWTGEAGSWPDRDSQRERRSGEEIKRRPATTRSNPRRDAWPGTS